MLRAAYVSDFAKGARMDCGICLRQATPVRSPRKWSARGRWLIWLPFRPRWADPRSSPDGAASTYFSCKCWASLEKVAALGDTWLQYRIDFLTWNASVTASIADVRWTYNIGNG